MLIDKPVGWTSHDAVAVARRQFGTRAVGHAGTLDPFATGLLVLLIGKATRLARYVEGLTKQYHAVFRFGIATSTDDATGEVIRQQVPTRWPDASEMEQLLETFLGEQDQVPPSYSARHVQGTRSYQLARQGIEVSLAPSRISVSALDMVRWEAPDLTLNATVGRGTYLRALARDMGERIGIPAHCAELRRTTIGPFSVMDAVLPQQSAPECLIPPADLLPGLPREQLDTAGAREISFGRRVRQRVAHDGPGALLDVDGHLLAVAEGSASEWQPTVVFAGAG